MLLRKLTCLLLSLVFLLVTAVPMVLADDTPPPTGGGSIHPWDISDGSRFGGPLIVARRQIIIVGYGPGGMFMSWWTPVPGDLSKTRTANTIRNDQEKRTPIRVATAVRK